MDYRLIVSFSSVPHMLVQVDFLMALCAAEPPTEEHHKRTLAACAAVLLAVCLDQGTLTILDTGLQLAKATQAEDDAAILRSLLSESLRRRVVRLPEVLSNSRFHLDTGSVHVRAIHDLISLRNDLMHVREEADVSDHAGVDTDRIKIDVPNPPPARSQ